MGLIVNDIVINPALRVNVISKNPDLEKSVYWAHVCELTDPTEWLGDGDFLMTTGIGIPHNESDQVKYIQRLHEAKIAGIVIGENMQAPENISALLDEAAVLGFNVLLMAYEIPFSAITKLINDYKKHKDYAKNNAIMQVYETARLGIKGLGIKQLLCNLQKNIRSPIYLIDPKTAKPWASGLPELSEQKVKILLNQYSKERNNAAVVKKIIIDDEEWMLLKLLTQNEASIIVRKNQWIDYILLSHVAAVIGIELERTRFEYENALRLGIEVFDELLQQRLPDRYITERLKPFNFILEKSIIFTIKIERPNLNNWNELLCRNNIRVLFKKQPNRVLGLVEDLALLPEIQSILGYSIGYSSLIDNVMRIPEAVRESNLALEFCVDSKHIISYESCSTIPFWLPQNLEVARQVYENVLGELEKYDLAQNSKLVISLKTYLEHNKSWLKASKELHIHKQSLIYRVKKIEEITSRSLSNMDDIAIFWFAIKSGYLIEKI
ncbi:PucR family transcriptional regulator [Psychrobacter frigidicola]|uniref:PucR family transcriptional regulator n=1 Tax=Psychrobacter frigidicola TaxID=45611 RepID=UPI00191960D8|nr:PucR family transcriptional regulator [Psychrobacter frigidicola]